MGAPTKAILGIGTTFKFDGLDVSEPRSVGDTGSAGVFVEATHLNSPDATREYVAGLLSSAETELLFNLDEHDAGQTALRAAAVAGEAKTCVISFPTGVTATFTMQLSGEMVQNPVADGILQLAVTGRITGTIVWGDSSVLPTYAWAPIDVPGAVTYLAAIPGPSMWQGSELGPNLQMVTADGQLTGLYDDPFGGSWRSVNDTTRNTFNTGPNRIAFLKPMLWHNSVMLMGQLTASGVYSLHFRIRIRNDGVAQTILDSNRGSGVQDGLNLIRTAANKIGIYYSSNGVVSYNYTSVGTLVEADGFVDVTIRFDGASGGDIEIGSQGVETFAQTNPTAGATGTYELGIGGRSGLSDPLLDFDLIQLLITNTKMSAPDVALCKAYDVAAAPSTFVRQLALATGGGFPWFNHLHRGYDLTDTGKLFSDRTGRTTPVTTLDDPIGTVAHINDSVDAGRDVVAPSDAARPLYKTDAFGAFFDGVDDQLDPNESEGLEGGGVTYVIVGRNEDLTNGSHFLKGAQYVAQSGRDYPSNPPEGAYFSFHVANAVAAELTQITNKEGANILAVRGLGESLTPYSRGAGVVIESASKILTRGLQWSSIGEEFIAGWQLDGRLLCVLVFNAHLSDAQLRIVLTGLADKYAGANL